MKYQPKRDVPPEVREHMRMIGIRGGHASVAKAREDGSLIDRCSKGGKVLSKRRRRELAEKDPSQ